MKKLCFLFLSLFSLNAFCAEVPELLNGIWVNDSRYVVFNTGYENDGKTVPQIVLRLFYKWYDDRAQESSLYTAENPRMVNNATQNSKAEEMTVEFVPLCETVYPSSMNHPYVRENGDVLYAEDVPSGAWNLCIKYLKDKTVYYIPVCVIGDKLYLNFLLKDDDSDMVPFSPVLEGTVLQNGALINGYWKDNATAFSGAGGLLISPPVFKKELLSYLITDSSVYHIRYWRTDMDYDSLSQAVFSDGDESFGVPKHLLLNGNTYTCVNGRGSRIRNIEKSSSFEENVCNNILVHKQRNFNGETVSYTVRVSTICALGKPYLELDKSGKSIEQIVAEDNSRRKPKPRPLFPPHGVLDFDWSIIENPPEDYNRRMLDLGK